MTADVDGAVMALLNRISILQGAQRQAALQELSDVAEDIESCAQLTPGTALLVMFELQEACDEDDVERIVALCLLLSNACVGDDQRVRWKLMGEGRIVETCTAYLQEEHSATSVFSMMDLVATLCTNNGELRAAFRDAIPAIMQTVRQHKTSLEVLFSTACTLATLTIADTLNGKAVVENNGIQVLLEILKQCTRLSAKDRRVVALKNEDDQHNCENAIRWGKQGLLNLMKVPFDVVDEKLEKANFGKFGELVDIDQLKWDLEQDRRRCKRLLEEFRAARQIHTPSSVGSSELET